MRTGPGRFQTCPSGVADQDRRSGLKTKSGPSGPGPSGLFLPLVFVGDILLNKIFCHMVFLSVIYDVCQQISRNHGKLYAPKRIIWNLAMELYLRWSTLPEYRDLCASLGRCVIVSHANRQSTTNHGHMTAASAYLQFARGMQNSQTEVGGRARWKFHQRTDHVPRCGKLPKKTIRVGTRR